MLDRILCERAARKIEQVDTEYTPGCAVKNIQLLNKDGVDLTVVFPPWHGGGAVLARAKEKLVKQNSAVLSFQFHDQILEPDINRVVQSHETIQTTASSAILELRNRMDYRAVHLLSISLGTVAMALTAESIKDFDTAQIIVGGSNLARSMWEGRRTQTIRQLLAQQGHTLEDLETAWESIAPIEHAGSFAGKPVQMLVSTTDTIIPAKYQEELISGFDSAGARLSVRRTRLGHFGSAGRFCYLGK